MNFNNQSVFLKCPFSSGKIIFKENSMDDSEQNASQNFVKENSIIREIWGKSDTILFIFAGAAAEFALNKAVDWLYFTGKLPSDPLERLFSTVDYARKIIFATQENSEKSIDIIRKIHSTVEKNRGYEIPDWAYRDVLFMLIHYSIISYELLHRKLSLKEKEEVYAVFLKVGKRMEIKNLPENYSDWLPVRASHVEENLQKSGYTSDLFQQYQKHLGFMRFKVMIEAQKLIVPHKVKEILGFGNSSMLYLAIPIFKMSRFLKIDWLFRDLLLPSDYKNRILELNVVHY